MRRLLQYRLSTLLFLVTSVSLAFGWLVYARDQVRKRQAMIEAHERAIEKLEDKIAYLEAFRRGVTETLEDRKAGIPDYSDFFPGLMADDASMKGYQAGADLVNGTTGHSVTWEQPR
jgi:hypothetical protein